MREIANAEFFFEVIIVGPKLLLVDGGLNHKGSKSTKISIVPPTKIPQKCVHTYTTMA